MIDRIASCKGDRMQVPLGTHDRIYTNYLFSPNTNTSSGDPAAYDYRDGGPTCPKI